MRQGGLVSEIELVSAALKNAASVDCRRPSSTTVGVPMIRARGSGFR